MKITSTSYFAKIIFVFTLSSFTFFNIVEAQPIITYGSNLATGLNNPVDVVNAGDSKLYIAQQNGEIKIYNGLTTLTTFMNLSGLGLFPSPLGNEQGLLSIAFHPQYASNRYFFIWYTASNGNVTLSRYRANTDLLTANPNTGVVLFSAAKPGSPYFTNHNGGKLNFGSDGKLYIGLGDGGSGGDPFNNAQNGDSYLGKMLRIDVDRFATSAPFYDIPADNPFISTAGFKPEIYALGLRNPWRWSFDRSNGDMWIADVGQSLYEEVNFVPSNQSAGINYGWNCREGNHNYQSGCTNFVSTNPIFEYDHTTGGQSITGGYVYRGILPANSALVGYYITTDFVTGNIWLVKSDGSFVKQTVNRLTNIAGFGEGIDGSLFAVRRSGTGSGLYRISLVAPTPVNLTQFSAVSTSNGDKLTWTTNFESNTKQFELEMSNNGTQFSSFATVPAQGNPNGATYTYQHVISNSMDIYYRILIRESDGSFSYSDIVHLKNQTQKMIRLQPNFIQNQLLVFSNSQPLQKIQIFNMQGAKVFEKSGNLQPGNQSIPLQNLPKSTYTIRFVGKNFSETERLVVL